MMERGSINITENEQHEFTVEVKLIEGTVWLSEWQIASIFNVCSQKIEANIRSIFKSSLLNEQEVTYKYELVDCGFKKEQILYNLEIVVFLSFRIASFEAKAFRKWFFRGFSEHMKGDKNRVPNMLIVLDGNSNYPITLC
ncbi:hypothetical protein LJC54_09885 [Parabacteroides sp. OttesenSCG-928-J18]|nr:hypothetical protein [Bacteroides sp. OttesenSCG-928-N06]MDL2241603.1 hypothetical protein [Bacteroidales bacterium OttesenSCG-928-L03]MDL2245791.1 hypothetical protein [Parabacteroides sp. OttesenSCG-928-J18]MDL2305299.1 hypothetical protein [Bacteroides sp. OttesenSCG-928-D19]